MTDTTRPLQNYIVQGKDASGTKQVERVKASSAQHAIDQLKQRGFTEIELETDDFVRSLQGAGGADIEDIDAEVMVRIKELSDFGFRFHLAKVIYKELRYPAFGVLAGLIVRRILQSPFNYWDIILILLLVAPLSILFFVGGEAGKQRNKIEQKYVEGDFEGMLSLADDLIAKQKSSSQPDLSLPLYIKSRAQALARLGRTQEAFDLIDTLNPTEGSRIQFLSHKASVYAAADQYQNSVNCYREATEIEPQNPMGWIGMAEIQAIHLNQPVEARQSLESALALPLSSILKDGSVYVEGAVLIAEGHFSKARERLDASLPKLKAFTHFSPLAYGTIALVHAQLVICCARTGDMEAARQHFKDARSFLTVHRIEPLLSRCKRELGIP